MDACTKTWGFKGYPVSQMNWVSSNGRLYAKVSQPPSDAKKAAVGRDILRAVMHNPGMTAEQSPRTPHSSSSTSSSSHAATPYCKHGAAPDFMPQRHMTPSARRWVFDCAQTPGAPQRILFGHNSLVSFSAVRAKRERLELLELPIEMFQNVMDWLPTFADRARVCATCKVASGLDWRRASPLRPDEELSGLGLGDVGARAVAWSFARPQRASIGELCLGNNSIGDAGAKAIAEVLKGGSTIRRLSMRENKITDVGAQALAAALSTNSILEELDLWGNCITAVGKQALVSASRCKIFLELESPSICVPSPLETMIHGCMPMLRAALFDWVSQVHTGGSAPTALDNAPDPQDTLFRTYHLVDSYLVRCDVQRTKLQIVGVGCTLVAARLDSRMVRDGDDAELVAWLAAVTDGFCTPEQVQDAAADVQEVLGFKMYQPTTYTFLRRFLRRTGWTEESFSLANYLIEVVAIDTSFLKYKPQAIAAAAAVLCRQYLSQGIGIQQIARWKSTLLKCAGVDLENELAPCVAAMGKLHAYEHSHPSKFVNRKYELSRLHAVAKISPSAPRDADFWASYMLANDIP